MFIEWKFDFKTENKTMLLRKNSSPNNIWDNNSGFPVEIKNNSRHCQIMKTITENMNSKFLSIIKGVAGGANGSNQSKEEITEGKRGK